MNFFNIWYCTFIFVYFLSNNFFNEKNLKNLDTKKPTQIYHRHELRKQSQFTQRRGFNYINSDLYRKKLFDRKNGSPAIKIIKKIFYENSFK